MKRIRQQQSLPAWNAGGELEGILGNTESQNSEETSLLGPTPVNWQRSPGGLLERNSVGESTTTDRGSGMGAGEGRARMSHPWGLTPSSFTLKNPEAGR